MSGDTGMIAPFNALRAAGVHAAEIAAPPYDVVTTEEARARADGKPRNFLHVSRAEIDFPAGADSHTPEIYDRAAQNLRNLIDDGAMLRSPAPCYFVYRMRMTGHSQTGLACGASLAAYADRTIRRHELTRPDKEDDRVAHMAALNAQTGPVLCAHRPHAGLTAILNEITRREAAPEIDVKGEDGVRHTLWAVDGGDTLGAIQSAADELEALYIADGHHRSAAAARVAEMRGETGRGEAAERFLAVTFPSNQLLILAYNRIVRDLGAMDEAAFLARLEEGFIICSSKAPIVPDHSAQIGLCLKSGWRLLDPREPLPKDASVLARLDVSLLTSSILQPLLDIGDPRTDPRLDFVGGADAPERIQALVQNGEAAAGFTVYPTAMNELMAVADSGQVMPPKSTWFEPKLADGLIANLID